MTKDHLTDFFPGWPWKQLSCTKIMLHFPEYPWISLHRAPDHNTITSGFFHQCLRFLRRIYVSVSNNRNRNCFFDSANRIPVCLSRIILLAGASMNCHCCCTGIFYDFCNLYRIYRISFKTDTDFRRHRLLYCMRYLCHNLTDQLRSLKKRRSLTIIDNLRNRTSHINIQNIKRLLLNTLRNFSHQIRFTSKYLHGNRMLHRVDLHKRNRIFIMKRNCFCTDHFCTKEACPLLFT